MIEYVQLQNESSSLKYFTSISNYIDVFPMLFVLEMFWIPLNEFLDECVFEALWASLN